MSLSTPGFLWSVTHPTVPSSMANYLKCKNLFAKEAENSGPQSNPEK